MIAGTDLEFVATVATGSRVNFLSAVQKLPENNAASDIFCKILHILFNFNQKRAKLLIMMHFRCLLLAKIVSIYAFSVCKILSPENWVV